MLTIRYAEPGDKDFWITLDKHISDTELDRKIRDRMGYVLLEDNVPAGLLRYNLFWDNTPFCNLLYITPAHQRKGLGKALMLHWEEEMKRVSTQADEEAQHFYRRLDTRTPGDW